MTANASGKTTKDQSYLDHKLLMEAASGQADLAKITRLISRGANPNARDKSGRTVLMIAVDKQDQAAAALLIDKGADMYARQKDGDAIFRALAHYDRNMVAMFLDKKFDPNRQPCRGNMTPLMWAANFHKLGLCEELATRGANIHAKNPDNGMTAMDYARNNLKPHIADRLLEIDAEIKARVERERIAEKERIEQERVARLRTEFEEVCNAGLPLQTPVRKMPLISFAKTGPKL